MLSLTAALFLLLLSMLAVAANAAEKDSQPEPPAKPYKWYCKNNSEKLQPVLPPEFSFIAEYKALWRGEEGCGKVIYLTFDAGYENGNVTKIVDILNSRNVTGTFFVLSHFVKSNPELVKSMSDSGHLICNHTANHPDMTRKANFEEFAAEIQSLAEAVKSAGAELAPFYRPPCGAFSERDLDFAARLGYRTVFWSYAYADWDNNAQMAPEKALNKLISHVHEGMVLLLHPTSGTNAEILGDFIDTLTADGWRFASIAELAKLSG